METFLLKHNIKYRTIIKILVVFLFVFLIFNGFLEQKTYASGLLDYGNGDNPFNKINDSWGQFVNDAYRNNYSLDAGNVGTFDVLDKALNALANGAFNVVLIIAWLGINIFNFCFNSNISDTFSSMLDSISDALHKGVFNEFFMIFFMVSLIGVVIYFARRNFAALFTHIIGVALISIMALVINSSGARNFVVETTNFSKDIGMTLIASLSGESDTNVAKNDMIGTLWGNLVHKPWVMLEFDGQVGVDDVSRNEAVEKSKSILSLDEKSAEREELTKQEIKDISFTGRLASTIILGLITIVKVAILILIGVIQIFLQILSNIMIVISPLILLMAIVPFFGGFNLIKWIGEKYLGIQVTIVLFSFIIGSLILIDKVVLEFFIGLGASFTVSLLIQCVCWILVIVFRKQLLLNLNKLQRRINGTIAAGRLAGKGLDKTAYYGNKAVDGLKRGAEKLYNPAKEGAVNLAGAAGQNIKYATKYTTGNAGIAAARFAGSVIDKVANKWSKNETASDTSKGESSNVGSKPKESANAAKVVDIKDKLNKAKVASRFVNLKDELNKSQSENKFKIDDLDNSKDISENMKNSYNSKKEKLEEDRIIDEGINIKEELGNRESIKEDINNSESIQDKYQDTKEKLQEEKEKVGVNLSESELEKNEIKESIKDSLEKVDDSIIDKGNGSIDLNIEKKDKSNKIPDEKLKKVKENLKEDKDRNRNVNLNKEIDNKESVKKKINDRAQDKETKSVAEEPKVISMNEARIKKGKEEINSDELKDNLRKNLQREYQEKQREKRAAIEKEKSKLRAEVLKNKLGVSSSQIKKKEKKLNKELKQIKSNKTPKKFK